MNMCTGVRLNFCDEDYSSGCRQAPRGPHHVCPLLLLLLLPLLHLHPPNRPPLLYLHPTYRHSPRSSDFLTYDRLNVPQLPTGIHAAVESVFRACLVMDPAERIDAALAFDELIKALHPEQVHCRYNLCTASFPDGSVDLSAASCAANDFSLKLLHDPDDHKPPMSSRYLDLSDDIFRRDEAQRCHQCYQGRPF